MSKVHALSHHFDQVPKAKFVAQVPAHTKDDYLAVEVPPLKQLFGAVGLFTASL